MPPANTLFSSMAGPPTLSGGEAGLKILGMVAFEHPEDGPVVAYVEQTSTSVRLVCRTLEETPSLVYLRPITIEVGEPKIECENEADSKGYRAINGLRYNAVYDRLIVTFPTDLDTYQNSVLTMVASTGAEVGWSSLDFPTRIGFLDSLGPDSDIFVKTWRINTVDQLIRGWRWDPEDGSIESLWELDPADLVPEDYTLCETSGQFWQEVPSIEEPPGPDVFESDQEQDPCWPGYNPLDERIITVLSAADEAGKNVVGKIVWINVETGTVANSVEINLSGAAQLMISPTAEAAALEAQTDAIEALNESQQFPSSYYSASFNPFEDTPGWAMWLPADCEKITLEEASETDYSEGDSYGSGLDLVLWPGAQAQGYQALGWMTQLVPLASAVDSIEDTVDDIDFQGSALETVIDGINDPAFEDPRIGWQNSEKYGEIIRFGSQQSEFGNPWHGHIIAMCQDGGCIVAHTVEEIHRTWSNTLIRAVQIAGTESSTFGGEQTSKTGSTITHPAAINHRIRLNRYANKAALPDPYNFVSGFDPDTGGYTGGNLPHHAILDHPTLNGEPVSGSSPCFEFDLWIAGVVRNPEWPDEEPEWLIEWLHADIGRIAVVASIHDEWETEDPYTGDSGNLTFGDVYGWDPWANGGPGEWVKVGTMAEGTVTEFSAITDMFKWVTGAGSPSEEDYDEGAGSKWVASGSTSPDLTYHLIPGYSDTSFYRCKLKRYSRTGALEWEKDISREDESEETGLTEPSTTGVVAIRPTRTGGVFVVLSKPDNPGESFGAGTPYVQYRDAESGALLWEQEVALEQYTWYFSLETETEGEPWLLFGGGDSDNSSNDHRAQALTHDGTLTTLSNFRKPLGWAGQSAVYTGNQWIFLAATLFGWNLRRIG